MKGIGLAVISFLFLVLVSRFFLRRTRNPKPYKLLVKSFLVSALFYTVLSAVTPRNFGGWPDRWQEPSRAVDFINGLLLLLFFYMRYHIIFYSTAFSGFSAQIFVLLDHPDGIGQTAVVDFFRGTSASHSVDRVTEWRLANLMDDGCIASDADGCRILPRGRRVGRIALVLKKLLAAGVGG